MPKIDESAKNWKRDYQTENQEGVVYAWKNTNKKEPPNKGIARKVIKSRPKQARIMIINNHKEKEDWQIVSDKKYSVNGAGTLPVWAVVDGRGQPRSKIRFSSKQKAHKKAVEWMNNHPDIVKGKKKLDDEVL